MDMKTPLSTLLAHKAGGNVTHSIAPTITVAAAVDILNQAKVGSVLVMDKGRLVGIFTERDVLRRVVGGRRDPAATLVADVMTRELAVMKPGGHGPGRDAGDLRAPHPPHPGGGGGEGPGVISQGDLNHWLVRNQEAEVAQLVDFVTGKYPA